MNCSMFTNIVPVLRMEHIAIIYHDADCPTGGFLRSCEHCSFVKYNLGLDSLTHLCMCACVQDFLDIEDFEQDRFESDHFTKHRMVVQSSMPVMMRNR